MTDKTTLPGPVPFPAPSAPVTRMNSILAYPAHVYRLDILMSKEVFAR